MTKQLNDMHQISTDDLQILLCMARGFIDELEYQGEVSENVIKTFKRTLIIRIEQKYPDLAIVQPEPQA